MQNQKITQTKLIILTAIFMVLFDNYIFLKRMVFTIPWTCSLVWIFL